MAFGSYGQESASPNWIFLWVRGVGVASIMADAELSGTHFALQNAVCVHIVPIALTVSEKD